MSRPLARARARLRRLSGVPLLIALALAGAGGVLAHAPYFIQPALAAALVVLVLALDGARRTRRPLVSGFVRAWAFAFGMFLAGAWWVANAFANNPNPAYHWMGPVAALLLAAGLALLWGLAGAVYARLSRPGVHRIAVFALVVFAAEMTRTYALSGFPWNLPGHVWPAGGPVSQAASLIGASGLSFLTLYAFASPAALISRASLAARLIPVLAGASLLAAAGAFGALRLADAAPEPLEDARLRVVQAEIPPLEKTYENRRAILRRYLEMSVAPGLEDVDALVWPEVAIPAYLQSEPELVEAMGAAFDGGPLLVTGAARFERGPEATAYYNSLFVIDFDGGQAASLGVYDKTRLVPFGEGNPVRALTERFGFTALARNFFTPGGGATTLDPERLPAFAPLICYEVIFPRFVPRGEARPAFLLNVSNDSWYGDSAGPRQHLNQARYRAIEEGLSMARAASGGSSGLIDPWGRGVALLPLGVEETLDIQILEGIDETLYGKHGDAPWAGIAFILLLTVHLVVAFVNRRAMHV